MRHRLTENSALSIVDEPAKDEDAERRTSQQVDATDRQRLAWALGGGVCPGFPSEKLRTSDGICFYKALTLSQAQMGNLFGKCSKYNATSMYLKSILLIGM